MQAGALSQQLRLSRLNCGREPTPYRRPGFVEPVSPFTPQTPELFFNSPLRMQCALCMPRALHTPCVLCAQRSICRVPLPSMPSLGPRTAPQRTHL